MKMGNPARRTVSAGGGWTPSSQVDRRGPVIHTLVGNASDSAIVRFTPMQLDRELLVHFR